MNQAPSSSPFKMVGGALCLDFVNTVGNRADDAISRDYLEDYAALVDWARQAGLVSDAEAGSLRRGASRQPDAAAAALDRAKTLREAMHTVVLNVAKSRGADPAALAKLNQFVMEFLARSQLVASPAGFRLEHLDDPADLGKMLWPVVRSAIDLLTSADSQRLRECAGHPCGWLFLDTSRGGRRRWCEMADCGNRAKVRRFRAQHRGRAA